MKMECPFCVSENVTVAADGSGLCHECGASSPNWLRRNVRQSSGIFVRTSESPGAAGEVLRGISVILSNGQYADGVIVLDLDEARRFKFHLRQAIDDLKAGRFREFTPTTEAKMN